MTGKQGLTLGRSYDPGLFPDTFFNMSLQIGHLKSRDINVQITSRPWRKPFIKCLISKGALNGSSVISNFVSCL